MVTGFETKAPWVISALVRDLGITPQQAAGLVGQLGHESEGLQAINERNPVVPGSRGGFGWAQWTGPRRRQFEQYAQNQRLDPSSDEANYGFLLQELTAGPESAVVARLRSAPDAQTAGRIFTDRFLRPGIPAYASRSKWTQRAEGAIGGPVAAAGGGAVDPRPATGPAGPVEAAGGGAGNEAGAGAQPPPPGSAVADTGTWWQNLARDFGKGGATVATALAQQQPRARAPGAVPAARIDQGEVPTIDPQQQEMQRNQLAMALARLNSGRLTG